MTHDTDNPDKWVNPVAGLEQKSGMVIAFEPASFAKQDTFSTAQKVTAAIVVIVAGVLIWRFA